MPRGRPDPFSQVADGGRIHLVASLQILEQERAQLDEPQRRLAPRDDGVHARAVAVVRADAAIAIAIEGGRVTARPTVALTGDEIDERCFLDLLHGSLSLARGRGGSSGAGLSGEHARSWGRDRFWMSIRGQIPIAKREMCPGHARDAPESRILDAMRVGIPSGWHRLFHQPSRSPFRQMTTRRSFVTGFVPDGRLEHQLTGTRRGPMRGRRPGRGRRVTSDRLRVRWLECGAAQGPEHGRATDQALAAPGRPQRLRRRGTSCTWRPIRTSTGRCGRSGRPSACSPGGRPRSLPSRSRPSRRPGRPAGRRAIR